MVRLEKIIYEQAVNNQTLKRARQIGSPSKWYTENRYKVYQVAANKMFNEGITGVILRKIEPLLAKATWQWMRDIALQRGLAMEDFLLFQDRQLRRDPFFETIVRQSCHPYQWIFFKARRMRYYKVERGVRGFYVPEYVRKEAADRLACETAQNKEVFEEFVFHHFMSDLTPSTHYANVPRWHPLIIFDIYGWFKPEAWDRLFLNEAHYDNYSQQEFEKAEDPWSRFNLDSENGRRDFEDDVNRFIELYPGTVVREGEKFNFQEYYAMRAIADGQDLGKYDKSIVAKVKQEVVELEQQMLLLREQTKPAKVLGSLLPEFLRPKLGKALQH